MKKRKKKKKKNNNKKNNKKKMSKKQFVSPICLGDVIITAKVVFDYAGDDHIIFPFLNDEGGSNHACCLVNMRLTCISLKTLAFLCNLIHAVNDL